MRNVFKNNGLACLLLGMMVGGGAVGGAWWVADGSGEDGGDSVVKVLVYGDKTDEVTLVDSCMIKIKKGDSGGRDTVEADDTIEPDMPYVKQYEEVVYLTPNGSKFHRLGCGSLSRAKAKGNVRELPISKAIRRGYGACGKCFK